MKVQQTALLLFALVLVFGSYSCKYEHGPGITLRTKKARVEGYWFTKEIINEDGSGETYTNSDSYTYTFYKNGRAICFYPGINSNGASDVAYNFNWEFTNSKEDIRWIDEKGDFETYEIRRLTNKEMWLYLKGNSDTTEIRLESY